MSILPLLTDPVHPIECRQREDGRRRFIHASVILILCSCSIAFFANDSALYGTCSALYGLLAGVALLRPARQPAGYRAVSMGRSVKEREEISTISLDAREYAVQFKRILAGAMLFLKRARVQSRWADANSGSNSDSGDSQDDSISILDLPDLALDSILCRLPAESLLHMAGVCREFRVKCRSDHLWEALVYEKWGRLAGPESYREWQRERLKSETEENASVPKRIWTWNLMYTWPLSLLNLGIRRPRKAPPLDSLMAWYWALETGSFWFRAQIYNREHGHVGFLLSCYDADLSYDRCLDSFRARYPPHGPRAVVTEENIPWERLRAAPVQTPAHTLHSSDCLLELKPGDHIEVQWRRNKEFPYGWWYGVVGHSDLCNSRNGLHCSCHNDNIIWLTFNQYTRNSRWRRAAIDRRNHTEAGNEAEGFYGGVRKLRTKDEIAVWESLWPAEILE